MGHDSSPEDLANRFLGVLSGSGLGWALLHGNEQGAVRSDVDLAIERPLPELLERTRVRLNESGIRPIMHTHYDIAGSDAMWFWFEDHGILHVDLLWDPRGVGRLGIRTTEVLRTAIRRSPGIQVAAPEWEIAYSLSKRLWKRQFDRLAALHAHGAEHKRLAHALGVVFGGSGRLALPLLAEGGRSSDWQAIGRALKRGRLIQRNRRATGGPVGLALSVGTRLARRVLRPVGAWIHVVGGGSGEVAEACSEEIGSALPWHLCEAWPRSGGMGFWLRRIAPVLWRPGLAVTWSQFSPTAPVPPTFTLTTRAAPTWIEAREIVLNRLEVRTWSRLG